MNTLKVAVVVSHPIQHFCPQYVSFSGSKNISLKVFFGSALGYRRYHDENFKQEISWGNLQLEKFDHLFLNGELVLPSDSKLDAKNLEKELLNFAPHVIIQYGYFQKLQRRAYAWANKNKVPIAYISDSEMLHPTSIIKQFIKSISLRRHFAKIAWFLTVGNANEDFYVHHGVAREKLIRMHFPIDLPQYEASYQKRDQLRDQIRKKFGIPADELVITVVGKLSAWKSQDHLIDAMAFLEKQRVYLHLFILGSGDTKDFMQQKANQLQQSKVHMPGFVDIAALPAYYAATDIYTHPAALEPHSIAISEAIYMGCPILLSDRCGSYGPSDDVQEGKNGLIFKYGNIDDLAAKLKLLAGSKRLRAEFGQYSHEIATTFQSTAHAGIVEKLRKIFHDKKNT